MGHLKNLLNLLQYCFCFMFWLFGQKACEINQGLNQYPPTLRDNPNHWTTREVPLWGNFIFLILNLFIFLNIFIFYWRIIALQNFVVFCQTSAWMNHKYTYIPSLLNFSPISLLIYPSRLIQSSCLSFLSQTANSRWLSISHMVM